MATKTGKLGIAADEIVASPILQGLEFLCQTFGYEMDSWERKAYERTLKGINGAVVIEAAQLLVDQASGGRKFYPIPKAPDWKGACSTVIAKRLAAAKALHLGSCDHSSQFIFNADTRRDERCPCWTRMMTAVEEIGRLELPPAREDVSELERSGS
jgi:hypothetical protein